jgi:hypothetical protein
MERNFSLELLAQLSFSESISADLAKNVDLIEILNSLASENPSNVSDPNEKDVCVNIIALIKQIKWNMKERSQSPQINIESLDNEKHVFHYQGTHIMISYNTVS